MIRIRTFISQRCKFTQSTLKVTASASKLLETAPKGQFLLYPKYEIIGIDTKFYAGLAHQEQKGENGYG